jgi:leader peptidase (prepilin peptidase)/N-methyltransferase
MNTFILLYPNAPYLILGILSLLVGSLLNVIIHRLPIMLDIQWRYECSALSNLPVSRDNSINLFFPRSFCPRCHTQIPAWHNIPLFSYLYLKGRCRHCKKSITWRYPTVEISSLLLSLMAGYYFGFHITLIFALLFIWLIICLFFIDLDHQLLPDSLTLSLLWIGLIANSQSLFTTLPNAVLSAAGAYISLWLFIKVFYLITGTLGMGNGDFKLFAAFGAWFGWTQLPFILILSSMGGAIIGAIYLKITAQSHKTAIPFGPFLCVSGLISLFYGKNILNGYESHFISALH